MRLLSLFSGIGGFDLAAKWVWKNELKIVGHSEIEPYACKVYHKHFPESPCLGDIKKIEWKENQADIICGGFPCQPHSIAGKRKGKNDERDLWKECVRALRGIRPRYALFENVPALLISNDGEFFNRVLTEIHESGYNVEWQIISARDVDAPHLRERIWLTCYPQCERRNRQSRRRPGKKFENGYLGIKSKNFGNIEGTWNKENVKEIFKKPKNVAPIRSDRKDEFGQGVSGPDWKESWVEVATRLCRMDDGVPNRVDRIKGLGNAIVPQIAAGIFKAIKEIE